MGRRWLVEVDDGLYIRKWNSFQECWYNKQVPELRPVTIPYATKFLNKKKQQLLPYQEILKILR